MEKNNKVTTVKRNQFIEILNRAANELNIPILDISFNNIMRYNDRQKRGVRIKFVGYNSKKWEPVYKRVTEVLNEVDGGGWDIDDRGGCYGDGWCIIKVYKE
jgi:hypothetical protein